ncbi:MAG: hypothetical protein ACRCZ2_14055, partial [Fusobacteriaceae bacterium]
FGKGLRFASNAPGSAFNTVAAVIDVVYTNAGRLGRGTANAQTLEEDRLLFEAAITGDVDRYQRIADKRAIGNYGEGAGKIINGIRHVSGVAFNEIILGVASGGIVNAAGKYDKAGKLARAVGAIDGVSDALKNSGNVYKQFVGRLIPQSSTLINTAPTLVREGIRTAGDEKVAQRFLESGGVQGTYALTGTYLNNLAMAGIENLFARGLSSTISKVAVSKYGKVVGNTINDGITPILNKLGTPMLMQSGFVKGAEKAGESLVKAGSKDMFVSGIQPLLFRGLNTARHVITDGVGEGIGDIAGDLIGGGLSKATGVEAGRLNEKYTKSGIALGLEGKELDSYVDKNKNRELSETIPDINNVDDFMRYLGNYAKPESLGTYIGFGLLSIKDGKGTSAYRNQYASELNKHLEKAGAGVYTFDAKDPNLQQNNQDQIARINKVAEQYGYNIDANNVFQQILSKSEASDAGSGSVKISLSWNTEEINNFNKTKNKFENLIYKLSENETEGFNLKQDKTPKLTVTATLDNAKYEIYQVDTNTGKIEVKDLQPHNVLKKIEQINKFDERVDMVNQLSIFSGINANTELFEYKYRSGNTDTILVLDKKNKLIGTMESGRFSQPAFDYENNKIVEQSFDRDISSGRLIKVAQYKFGEMRDATRKNLFQDWLKMKDGLGDINIPEALKKEYD